MDIIGMKVNYINVALVAGEFPISNGFIRVLKSTGLSRCLKKNNYYTCVSTNSTINTLVNAESVSNIIGWAAPSSTELNNDSQVKQFQVNRIMPFARPYDIDFFDWSVEGLNGNLSAANPYAVEIVFEFYHTCHCS
jgi:hypothetical protein